MNLELLQLVSDTLAHIRETTLISVSPKAQKPPAFELHYEKKSPPPLQKQQKETLLPDPPASGKKHSQEVMVLDKIRKHLPRLKLIKEIPSPLQVAIIAFHLEDLAFLKNLAKAIQDRFCSVKLIDGNKAISEEWNRFFLVITQKKLSLTNEIVLETLPKNSEEKKALWSTICQHLSPKSS